MFSRSHRIAAVVGAITAPLTAVPLLLSPANADTSPTSYTVPSGIEVVETVLVGGAGGDAVDGATLIYAGGAGCRVQAALPVDAGDSITWTIGNKGGSPGKATAANQSGGAGGTGARPGGTGGAITLYNVALNTYRGPGGGGASSVSVGGTEAIIAAGGGGATHSTSGGQGCPGLNNPEGANGAGSYPTAEGATTASAGGAGGPGVGSPNVGPTGGNGSGANDSPAGRGGTGGEGRYYGSGGGGGGGGISGGGGGGGQYGTNGSIPSGAAGLSGILLTASGLLNSYSEGTDNASLVLNVIQIPALQTQTPMVGTSFNLALNATFAPVLEADATGATLTSNPSSVGAVTWTMSAGSPSLPTGLSLATNGTISGTPSAAGDTTVNLTATAFDAGGDVRARSVTSLAFTVQAAPPSSTTTVVTTTTVDPPVESATTNDESLPALPSTGSSSQVPLLVGVALLILGIASTLRRRLA